MRSKKAWEDRKGLVGVHIHNLLDRNSRRSYKGRNPFDDFSVDGVKLSSIVKAYDPPFTTSTYVYNHITSNIAGWVEEAITIRGRY